MPTKGGRSKATTKRKSSSTITPPGRSWLILKRRPSASAVAIAFALLFVAVGGYILYGGGLAAGQTELQSGIQGNGGGGPDCIDSNGGIYACNGSAGENWGGIDGLGRLHINGLCLAQSGANATVGVGASAQGRAVVAVSCGSSAPWGGAWTWNGHTLRNNHAGSKGGSYCLDVRGAALNGSLDTYSCNGGSNQNWFVGTYSSGTPKPTATPGGGGGGGSTGANDCQGYNRKYGLETDATQAMCNSAHKYMAQYGMNTAAQIKCLSSLWIWESNWRVDAQNPSSPAYGIPQADPGSKMSSMGADWRTNPDTQIHWGVAYIHSAYSNSACNAWASETGRGYYVVPAPAPATTN